MLPRGDISAAWSRERRYSADGYFYKATVLKALYPGDLEYDVDYQTYAEKAG